MVACNKKESQAVPEVEKKAEGSTSKPDTAANVAPKPDSAETSFDLSIEGYKASILGQAIYQGSIEKFKGILKSGARIDKCLTDETYIYDALYSAIAFDKKNILDYIIQNKLYADINKAYSEDAETPLTMACAIQNKGDALQASKLLITNGAKVDGAGPSGGEETKYPLLIATTRNNIELVRFLVAQGAKKDVTSNSGASPSSIAQDSGFSQLADILK